MRINANNLAVEQAVSYIMKQPDGMYWQYWCARSSLTIYSPLDYSIGCFELCSLGGDERERWEEDEAAGV